MANKIGVFLFSLLASLILSPISATAEGPDGAIKEMLRDLKKSGPVGLIQYVNWNEAFKDLNAEERSQIGVNSPTALSAFYRRFFNDPTSFIKSEMAKRVEALPPEQRNMVMQQMEPIIATMQQEMQKQKAKITRTEFTVGQWTTVGDGSEALVAVTSTVDGQSETNDVSLKKNKAGVWKLKSLKNDFTKGISPKTGGGMQMR